MLPCWRSGLDSLSGSRNWTSRNGRTHVSSAPHSSILGTAHIYMELLHASSRLRRDTRVETARPSTGLVKILCTPKAQKEGPINATLHNKGFAHWLGAICHAQSLYVWVPAHWAPCICTVVKNRTTEFDRKRDHEALLARAWGHEVEQQAQRDGAGIIANATVVEGVAYFLRAVDLRPGIEDIPSLVISIRAPWLELPVADFVNTMQTIYQGVLDGIFCQRPIAAWFSAQCKRIQMTIILPSSSSLDVWQNTLLRYTSCWPFRLYPKPWLVSTLPARQPS